MYDRPTLYASINGRILTAALFLFFCIWACRSARAYDAATPDTSAAGVASDLIMAASVAQTGSWASNPLLSTNNKKALYGSTTSPELLLTDTSPNSLFSLDGRVDQNEFNQSVFNSTDVHATTNLQTQNQRWSMGATQHTDYDTTRTSELSNFGLSNVAVRHLGLTETPQITFNPTAQDSLSLAGSATTSHYDSSTYTSYNVFAATPSYARHLNLQNTVFLNTTFERYQTTSGRGAMVDSVGPLIGWSTLLSPRISANASVGAQASRETLSGFASTPWKWQYVFTSGVAFTGLQDTIDLSASRNQTPYGNGTDALQTNVALTENHSLNSYLALGGGITYLTSEYSIDSPGSIKSLASAHAGLTYHATPYVDVSASYQYRRETVIGTSQTPQDNAVTLNLSCHPKVWTLMP